MKNRIISLLLVCVMLLGCTPRFKMPSLPKIPNISNSVTIPKINIKF